MTTTGRTLITGASSGLGAALARELSGRGEILALCARRVDRLEEVRSSLAGPAAVAALDVTDHDAVRATFDALHDETGGLDRVVVNAGTGRGIPVGRGGFATNRAILETNLVAALAQCEAAMSIFRAQGRGHLVVITSVAGERGLAGDRTAYAASKAALSTLAEGIRHDVAATPIRVTTIAPGFVRTELNAGLERPLVIEADVAAREIADVIARAPAHAYVPAWPWGVIASALRVLPLALLRRLS